MEFQTNHIIPDTLSSSSRLWIYQSDRRLTQPETDGINAFLQSFVSKWKAHGNAVKGYAQVVFDYFILIMADESNTEVSGCSTDSSVRIIKEIETTYLVNMFNRENLAFVINDSIKLIPLNNLHEAISENKITPDTLYFNNTISFAGKVSNEWLVPIHKSWLAGKFNFKNSIINEN